MTEAANTSTSPSGSPSAAAAPAASPAASDPSLSQSPATTSAPAAPVRPTELADKSFDPYFDPAKGVQFGTLAKDFQELRAFKAQDDLRRAAVPAKPDDYKLALPQTFEMPKDPATGKPYDFKFDETDPRLAPIREFAQKRGIDQTGFSELLAIHAQYELGEQQQINSARLAEQGKLGANGPARIDAISTFLTAKLGTAKGSALMDRLVLADDIVAMEDLVKAFSSQGGGSFSQGGREGTKQRGVTEEEYQKMSLSERREMQLANHNGQRAN